jgi:eukaryotic-like serine/threonine-protein kinase
VIGETVSHYRVVGKLGVGGMGVVYDAEDLRLPRRAALKFLPEELAGDGDASRRLRREAQAIALLNHPNICTIYEVDEHNGRPFIAMERLDGRSLKGHLARKKLDTAEILDIALQTAQALEAAHAKGIVHRDIKPGNIFIDDERRVKVLDFGLARQLPQVASDNGFPALDGSTMPGRPVGTASYMAPERILQLPLDPRCDLFSLGVVMYEMATGRLPFAGASPAETVTNILEREPIPATKLSPDRPGQLDRIIRRLVAKQADERYSSAAALRADLQSLQRHADAHFLKRAFKRWFTRFD